MRIAMIGQKGMPATYGGVERHVHDLAVRLVLAGQEVTCYSRAWYAGATSPTVEGVQQCYTPSINTKHFDTITHVLSSTLHSLFQKYDVIHYHGIGPSLLAWIPRVFSPSTKIVITFHSIDRHHQKWGTVAKLFLRLGERAACLFAHETITVSQSLQQYCRNEYDTETTYIPNGVPLRTKTNRTTSLETFGLESGRYLVMISRLVPHKGAHILIEAWKRLKAQHQHHPKLNDLKLAIVGGSVHTDEYVRSLTDFASDMNDVVFTGFQSGEALNELLDHATALVHPSLNEGLPITVLEAMAAEKMVLVSAIPEHRELITDNRCVFTENNVQALVKTLETMILETTTEEQTTIGIQHRITIANSYSWDVLVPQVLALYRLPSSQPEKTGKTVIQPTA